MAGQQKLVSCIAYCQRLARKSDLDDVAQLLSHALFSMTRCPKIKHPISLCSALGLEVDAYTQSAPSHRSTVHRQKDEHSPSKWKLSPSCLQNDSAFTAVATGAASMDMATQTLENILSEAECKTFAEAMVEGALTKANVAIEQLKNRIYKLECGQTVSTSSQSFPGPDLVTDATATARPPSSDAHVSSLQILREEHRLKRMAEKERRRLERQLNSTT